MGQAVTDENLIRAAEEAAANATGLSPAALLSKTGDQYKRFIEAYMPDPKNDRAAQFAQAAESGKLEIDGRFLSADGDRVPIRLREGAAARYAKAENLEQRAEVFSEIVREALQPRVDAIIKRLRENGGDPDSLHPIDEAFLRSVGCLEDAPAFTAWRLREGERGEPPAERYILREGLPGSDGFPALYGEGQDVGSGIPFMNGAYMPYGAGPFGQQMYLGAQWDMLAKAFVVATHHPVAKSALITLLEFVYGPGVKVSSKDKVLDEFLQEFWKRNKMNWRTREWFIGKRRDGEQFIQKLPLNDGTGRMAVRSIDPTWIWEIVTDSEDYETIFYYRMQGATRTQLYAPPVNAGTDAVQRYIIRDLKPDEVIHRKINVGPAEVRGRSDFASVLGWLALLNDFFEAVVGKERASAAVALDVSVEGGLADVQAVMQNFVLPSADRAGSANFHTSSVEVTDVGYKPTETTGSGTTFEGLMTMVANGINFPRAYLNAGGDDMTKAGTLTATAPFAKHVRGCQTEEREMLEELLQDVIDEGKAAGVLSGVNWDKAQVEIDFPDVVEADAVADIPLLEQGEAMQWISHETAGREFAKRIKIKNYDFDAEQKAIQADMGPDMVEHAANMQKHEANMAAWQAQPDPEPDPNAPPGTPPPVKTGAPVPPEPAPSSWKGTWKNMQQVPRKPTAAPAPGAGSGQPGDPGTTGTSQGGGADDTLSNEGTESTDDNAQGNVPLIPNARESMRMRENVVDDAAQHANTNPSEKEKAAGNYKMGHVRIQGLDVTIENPKASTRSGVGKDGTPWQVIMPAHYGYIRRTEGADGEHVDVYIGPDPESQEVWVIDQVDSETGAFDEHKALIGYRGLPHAIETYFGAHSDGKGQARLGAIHHMTMPAFKEWLKGDTTKAASTAVK